MKFTYPIKLTADPEGGYIARAVDIPEALTFGRIGKPPCMRPEMPCMSR